MLTYRFPFSTVNILPFGINEPDFVALFQSYSTQQERTILLLPNRWESLYVRVIFYHFGVTLDRGIFFAQTLTLKGHQRAIDGVLLKTKDNRLN